MRSRKQKSNSDEDAMQTKRPVKHQTVDYLYPEDLIPYTRKPFMVIVDSENSAAFRLEISFFAFSKVFLHISLA